MPIVQLFFHFKSFFKRDRQRDWGGIERERAAGCNHRSNNKECTGYNVNNNTGSKKSWVEKGAIYEKPNKKISKFSSKTK